MGGGGKTDEMVKNLSKSKKSKNNKSGNLTRVPNIEAKREPIFLTLDTRKTFNHLRQAFLEALILQHIDPECYIWIETDASGYAIGGVLSQLNFDWVPPKESNLAKFKILTKFDFGQWYPVAYFSRKMIPAKT